MKTLNVRLVAILLVCVLVVAGAVYFLHAYQVRRNADIRLTMAEEAEQRAELAHEQGNLEEAVKEYDDAIDNLGWYVNFRPDDLDTLQKIGLLRADLAFYPEILERHPSMMARACSLLEKLLREDPERMEARRKLVQLYTAFRRQKDGMAHLNAFPEDVQDDGEFLEVRGRCLIADGNDAEARDSLQRAVQGAPEQVTAYPLLAWLLQSRLGLPTEADNLMRQLVASNPDSSQAHLSYGNHLIGLLAVKPGDVRKHPILLDAMVPKVLRDAVEEALAAANLEEDDPDASLLVANQKLLADAVKRGLAAFDPDLALGDPKALWLAAMGRARAFQPDPADLSDAKKTVLEELKSELESAEHDALLVAEKHGVLVGAMERAAKAISDPNALWDGARDTALADSQQHAQKARELASEARHALSLGASRDAPGQLSLAAKVLVDALGRVLELGKTPLVLGLAENRALLVKAVDEAIQAGEMSLADRDLLLQAARRGNLIRALRSTLTARELAPRDRGELSLDGENGVLARVVQRALKTHRLAFENIDRSALLLAVRCHYRKEENDEARQLAERGIELYKDDVRMYLVLAEIELQAGRQGRSILKSQRDKAVACLRKGLPETDNNAQLLWQIARLLLEAGKTAETQEIIDLWPDDAEYSRGDRQRVPAKADAVGYLKARIEYLQNHWLAAIRAMEKIRPGLTAYRRPLMEADLVLARCYRQLGNTDKELDAYERILNVDPLNFPARAGVTEALGRAGRTDEAIDHYRQLAKMGELSLVNQIELAQLLLRRNLRLDAAQRDWREVEVVLDQLAARHPDAAVVPILRAQVLIAQDRPEDAERLLLDARDKNRDKAELWNMLAWLAQRKKDWQQTEALLDEAEKELGDVVALRLGRAQYLVRRYGKESAQPLEELAKDAEKFSEKDRQRLLLTLSMLAQGQESWQQAESLLGKAEQLLGDSVTLRFARAQYLIGRYQNESAEQLRKLAENTAQFSEADQLRLWKVLLALAIRVEDNEQVKRLGRRLLEKRPNDVRVRFQLFELGIRSKDYTAMKQMLEEIEKVEGKGPMSLYAQAVLLSVQSKSPEDKELDEALGLLDRARELRPSWSQLLLLRAGIYDQKGNQELALENYLEAIKMGNRTPGAIRRAVRLLTQQGRNAEAMELFALLEGGAIPGLADFGKVGIEPAIRAGDLERAEKLARRYLGSSDDYRDQTLFGRILGARGWQMKSDGETAEAQKMLSEAEEVLRHAVELSAENTETWTALIQFLGHTDQTAKAQDAIEEARQKIPADQALLAMARWYEALSRFDQARRMYESALAATPDDPVTVRAACEFYLKRNDALPAERQLKRIANGQVKSPPADLNWARRGLAVILVNRGGYKNFQDALALIEKNFATGQVSVQDKTLLARLLGPDRRKEAIELLESLGTAATAEDQFQLWRLYRDSGDLTRANAQIGKLLGRHGNQPKYVAAYVEWLLEQNVLSDASVWLNTLEKLAADDFTTTRLRAELLFRRKQFKQAFARVRDFLDRPDAQPVDPSERLRLVVQTLDRLTRRLGESGEQKMAAEFASELEPLYERYVRQRPAHGMYLAAFLARQGRIEDALTVVQRAWRDSEPLVLAQALSVVLKSPAATAPQVQQGMKTLDAALKEYDRPTELLLVLADLAAHQKKYDQAEATYREILKMDQRNPVAMNNLAVLLALRGVKLQESLRLINRAIELAGPNASMLDSRASVYLALGQANKALADLRTAITTAPSPINHFHLAQAHDLDRNRGEAARAMKRAVELGLKSEMMHSLELPTYNKLRKLLN